MSLLAARVLRVCAPGYASVRCGTRPLVQGIHLRQFSVACQCNQQTTQLPQLHVAGQSTKRFLSSSLYACAEFETFEDFLKKRRMMEKERAEEELDEQEDEEQAGSDEVFPALEPHITPEEWERRWEDAINNPDAGPVERQMLKDVRSTLGFEIAGEAPGLEGGTLENGIYIDRDVAKEDAKTFVEAKSYDALTPGAGVFSSKKKSLGEIADELIFLYPSLRLYREALMEEIQQVRERKELMARRVKKKINKILQRAHAVGALEYCVDINDVSGIVSELALKNGVHPDAWQHRAHQEKLLKHMETERVFDPREWEASLPVLDAYSEYIRQLEDCGSKTKRDIARLEADNLRVKKALIGLQSAVRARKTQFQKQLNETAEIQLMIQFAMYPSSVLDRNPFEVARESVVEAEKAANEVMVLEANRKNKEFEYMLKMYPRLFVTIRAKLKEIDEGRGGPLKTGDLSRLYEEREDGMHVLNIEKATEFLKEFVAERQREILEIEAAQGKAPAKEGEEGLLNWEIYEKMHEDESFFNFMFPEIHSMKIAGSVEDQLLDPTVFEEIVQYEQEKYGLNSPLERVDTTSASDNDEQTEEIFYSSKLKDMLKEKALEEGAGGGSREQDSGRVIPGSSEGIVLPEEGEMGEELPMRPDGLHPEQFFYRGGEDSPEYIDPEEDLVWYQKNPVTLQKMRAMDAERAIEHERSGHPSLQDSVKGLLKEQSQGKIDEYTAHDAVDAQERPVYIEDEDGDETTGSREDEDMDGDAMSITELIDKHETGDSWRELAKLRARAERDLVMKKRRYKSKKYRQCVYCLTDHPPKLEPMNVPLLTMICNEAGLIRPKRETGFCPKHQRKIKAVVKRATNLGLLSYKKGIFTPHNPFKIPPFKQYMPGITAEDLMNMLDRDDNDELFEEAELELSNMPDVTREDEMSWRLPAGISRGYKSDRRNV